MKLPRKIAARQDEIMADYLKALDVHLADIVSGKATEMFEIRDIAALLYIHPTHLSNTIKQITGKAPCFFFEEKIMDIAKDWLLHTDMTSANIAERLTFDPSNFTKFFKRFAGETPRQFRENAQVTQF
jgi:AraC-like DNA-binding protein